MTAAVPLVERLAEVLARHRREFDNDCACSEYVLDVPYEQHVARALLPVVEQAVAEARGEALREAAEEGPATTATDQLWRMWLRDRADAIATTEGAP